MFEVRRISLLLAFISFACLGCGVQSSGPRSTAGGKADGREFEQLEEIEGSCQQIPAERWSEWLPTLRQRTPAFDQLLVGVQRCTMRHRSSGEESTRLKIELGYLFEDQYTALRAHFAPYFGAMSPIEFSEDRPYQLSDFLPPLVQATEGLTFNPEQWVADGFRFGGDLLTNCWGTAYELVRNDPEALSLFYLRPDVADEALANERYSASVALASNAAAAAGGEPEGDLQQLLDRVQPGDLVLIRVHSKYLRREEGDDTPPDGSAFEVPTVDEMARESMLAHALVMIDRNLVYEKVGVGLGRPYRLETFIAATALYGGTADGIRDKVMSDGGMFWVKNYYRYELRRPRRKTLPVSAPVLPDPSEAFEGESIHFGGSSFIVDVPYVPTPGDAAGRATLPRNAFAPLAAAMAERIGKPDLYRLPAELSGRVLAVFGSTGRSFLLGCDALVDHWSHTPDGSSTEPRELSLGEAYSFLERYRLRAEIPCSPTIRYYAAGSDTPVEIERCLFGGGSVGGDHVLLFHFSEEGLSGTAAMTYLLDGKLPGPVLCRDHLTAEPDILAVLGCPTSLDEGLTAVVTTVDESGETIQVPIWQWLEQKCPLAGVRFE